MLDSYWWFVYRLQEAFRLRVEGAAPPWIDDAVVAAHRFTNVNRASDRVSQYLIRKVIYSAAQDADERGACASLHDGTLCPCRRRAAP